MSMMEGVEGTERRYNTRFRGVPRSVFTYPRAGKKPGPKSKFPATLKTELRDDFVYTKLGKKPSHQQKQAAELVIKIEGIKKEPTTPQEDEPENEPEEDEPVGGVDEGDEPCEEEEMEEEHDVKPTIDDDKQLSNGIHHSDAEQLNDEPVSDSEKTDSKCDVKPKSETNIIVSTIVTPTVKEFVVSGSSSSKSVWITAKEKLSFNGCNVASYNPKTKMFRCVICQAVGFMSRIGEHYLGTHCNAKVFQCPQCSYCSAWWRCVRNHMSKNHGISNAPASMWKNQPLLDEIMQLLQNLKYSVDCEDRVVRVAENSGKRYICPKCPYATDRRDLYNRHENIHREEKPFQCYVCYKLFNRADHVKKHFCRIHKDYDYDINLIRRLPSKRSRLPVTPYNGLNGSLVHQTDVCSSTSNTAGVNSSSMQLTQSKLLNCLTSPPTMVKSNQDVFSSCTGKDSERPNETFQNTHSNLLSYLTRSNFPSKPPLLEMPSTSATRPEENYSAKRLQEGVLATFGFPPVLNNVPKEFICPYCPWHSTDVWALRMHTATHYNNACPLCNFRSTKESDMELHMWECHRKRPCNKCSFLADSIIMLDAHMTEKHTPPKICSSTPAHTQKSPFRCRVCSQPFELRSDMEAHSIFIHNQVLRECKQDGCDFCSTDPDILEDHKHERHKPSLSSTETAENKSASRTQCLYCGCDFADSQSLCLHEEIFHENPLQIAGRRPLDPYCCAICGYATPKQLMMMEHLRVHGGQELCCRAADDCHFRTPYDTVLREHVLQSHSSDDGIVRCPHCGYRCSTRNSFTFHYKEYHHPFCCVLCEEVEHMYFVSTKASSYLDSTIAALFPFAKKVNNNSCREPSNKSRENLHRVPYIPKDSIIMQTVRRSRKQLQPRKVVQDEEENTKDTEENTGDAPNVLLDSEKTRHSDVNKSHVNSFISLYARKLRNLTRVPLLRCRLCVRHPFYFRQKKNFVFHISWHRLKKSYCSKCTQIFRHRYQVLLHKKREHRE